MAAEAIETKLTKPLGIFRLHTNYPDQVRVLVWGTLEAMYEFLERRRQVEDEREYRAFYKGKIDHEVVFSEIHLVNGDFGGGIFAHELQHFILAWMTCFDWGEANIDEVVSASWEEIPGLVGNMTSEFYTKYYDSGLGKPGYQTWS